ncbi:hypothetical protein CXIVA_03700 [Clostridium sp. SY8519]|uniref:DUF362 domain-containing protein n=1 Tax=Clostridium sp. (strain SY8519) TaxID=1042156 RepID=UPI00021719A0|nr:DUF362 domain-containing protein [Clostridium sp. SY8519]BAK46337.1 hypothetical protein CXIVA_03700 [Clostridium sp. SY8519]
MTNEQILKIYGTDYRRNTRTLLEAADLAARIPSANSRILIKPNLVSPVPASAGGTTHPEIVAGIIEYLQDHGFSHLRIAEGSWVGDRTPEAFDCCGYYALARRYGVELLDTQQDTFYSADCGGMTLKICSCVRQADFIINVPVLKGHCQTKITCALKNMKGLIPNAEKRRFHALGLHNPIAHLSAGIRQDFLVVDHICGDLDFEDGGNPVVRDCIMAAADPVLTDAYVCHLLHYRPEDVPYLTLAAELGVGSLDLTRAEILTLGDSRPEELPYTRKVVELADAVTEVESCSACYGYLIPALDRLKEEGLFSRLTEKICIGQGFRGQTGTLGVGNCTRGFAFCVEGCPPTENQIYDQLKAYLSSVQPESQKESADGTQAS